MESILRSSSDLGLLKVLGPWTPNVFQHTRKTWVRCFGYPSEGWKEELMRAFGGRLGRVLEVDSRNLSREDCCTLNLFELKVTDQIPHLVKLNLKGTSFDVALAESLESLPRFSSSEQFSGNLTQSKPSPLRSVQISRNVGTRVCHAGSTKVKAVAGSSKAGGRQRKTNEEKTRREGKETSTSEGSDHLLHMQPLSSKIEEELACLEFVKGKIEVLLKDWVLGQTLDLATRSSSKESVSPVEPKLIEISNQQEQHESTPMNVSYEGKKFSLRDFPVVVDAGSEEIGMSTSNHDN